MNLLEFRTLRKTVKVNTVLVENTKGYRRLSVMLSNDTWSKMEQLIENKVTSSKADIVRAALDIFIAYKFAEFCKHKTKNNLCLLWGVDRVWECNPMKCPVKLKEVDLCQKKVCL